MKKPLGSNSETIFASECQVLKSLGERSLSKNRVVLLGDAVMSLLDEPDLVSLADDPRFLRQSQRVATSFLSRLTSSQRQHLNVYVDKDVVTELQTRQVKPRRVYLAIDSILRYIKLFTLRRNGILLCVSKINTTHKGLSHTFLVEEYRFSYGAVVGVMEKRHDASVVATELSKTVRESLRGFSAELRPSVVVCGPACEEIVNSLSEFNPSNVHDKVFSHLVSNGFGYEEIKNDSIAPYLLTVTGSVMLSVLMVQNGVNELKKSQSLYNEYVAGFESLYAKGKAPIELVETRASFLADREQHKSANYLLPKLVSAAAKVKSQMPELELAVDDLSIVQPDDGTGNQGDDYTVRLKFNQASEVTPEQALEQWQRVFKAFSNEMQGVAKVANSPTTVKIDSEREQFVMTISGMFEGRQ